MRSLALSLKVKLFSFFAVLSALMFPISASAVTPYDELVSIADLSGLQATQIDLLGIIITMVLISTAALIIIGILRKGRVAGR